MIKQIFKIVWAQRRSNFLIWMELMLVSLLLWMVMDQLFGYFHRYSVPKGFDVENTYYVDFQMIPGRGIIGSPSKDSLIKTYKEPLLSLYDKVKRNPNVEVAAISQMSRPYNGGNSWSDIKAGKKNINVYLRYVDPEFFDVFRIPFLYGKTYQGADDSKVVVSKTVADSLFKSASNAVGKRCAIDGDTLTIAGVTDTYKYYDFANETPTIYRPMSVAYRWTLGNVFTPEICIRLKDNASADAIEKMKKELSNLGDSPYYLVDITSFDFLRSDYFKWTGEVQSIKMSMAIILFFLVNVLLGIVGTFWFRTEQRKNEIGLRMAIGSSKSGLKSYFLTESLILLLLAVVPSAIITIQMRFFDVNVLGNWEQKIGIFILSGVATLLILAGMIMLGTWIPVRKASKIQPSEALHYE